MKLIHCANGCARNYGAAAIVRDASAAEVAATSNYARWECVEVMKYYYMSKEHK